MAASRRVLNPNKLYAHLVRKLGASAEAHPGISATDLPQQKNLHDLDGPTGWPVVGNFLHYVKKENKGRVHEVQAEFHKKYGPVFKESWGPNVQLHTCDPDAIETILRSEKKHPSRPPFQSWRLYRKIKEIPTGLVTGLGDEWLRIRQILSKKMLKPTSIAPYAEDLGVVTSDLMTRIKKVRDTYGDEELAQKMPNEFYKWSMEAVGTVLFDTRLGCLNDPMPQRVEDFIAAINDMLSVSLNLIAFEKLHQRLNTPYWRKCQDSWDKIFEIGKYYIDAKIEDIKAEIDSQKSSSRGGDLLRFMLANEKLSVEDVYVNATEILLSGVDTTSNSLCFTLYLLAKNPHVQQKLREEVDRVVGQRVPTAEDFEEMPYLRAVLRESLRLYPVVTMNVRVLENDIDINGYLIPKDTMCVMNIYAAGRKEAHFKNAEQFIPERWLRDGPNQLFHHAFSSLPFGFGNRSCIGKRIAHLELNLALTKICQQFHLEAQEDEIKPYLRTLLTPGAKVPVRFVDR